MRWFWITLLGILTLQVQAGIIIHENTGLSKKERKVCRQAARRALLFYTWYINYQRTNQMRPGQHPVLNQHATLNMRETAFRQRERYDAFLATDSLDLNSPISLTPQGVKEGRIDVLGQVEGSKPYRFHIDMIRQNGNWYIDLVVAEEDLNPRIHEKE